MSGERKDERNEDVKESRGAPREKQPEQREREEAERPRSDRPEPSREKGLEGDVYGR